MQSEIAAEGPPQTGSNQPSAAGLPQITLQTRALPEGNGARVAERDVKRLPHD